MIYEAVEKKVDKSKRSRGGSKGREMGETDVEVCWGNWGMYCIWDDKDEIAVFCMFFFLEAP